MQNFGYTPNVLEWLVRPFNPFRDIWILKEIATVVFGGASATWAWMKIRKAPSWPSGQGTVMSTYAANNSWRGWNCQVTYSYVANNEYYSGTHSIHAWTKKRAEKLESSLKGRSIAIRYSPADHTLSTLLREDQIGGFGDF